MKKLKTTSKSKGVHIDRVKPLVTRPDKKVLAAEKSKEKFLSVEL
jgi:hypothetical protein